MCGRYALYDTESIEKRFNVKVKAPIKPNFNVAPTQSMPVIREIDGNRKLEMMHWGIPRILGKDIVKEIINTRSDKAFGGFWKKQVTTQRILVPANAFYEWKKEAEGKTPYLIEKEDASLYAFAGIWNSWKDKDGNEFNAYSIMTTDPNQEMKQIHDRMPVILHIEDEEKWLAHDLSSEEIAELLLPPEDNYLKMFEVSKEVNNVRNNDRGLLTPISS